MSVSPWIQEFVDHLQWPWPASETLAQEIESLDRACCLRFRFSDDCLKSFAAQMSRGGSTESENDAWVKEAIRLRERLCDDIDMSNNDE